MVDKTIPYKNIIMVAENLTEQKPTLPEGFYLDTYREGDELSWAEMEVFAGSRVELYLAAFLKQRSTGVPPSTIIQIFL